VLTMRIRSAGCSTSAHGHTAHAVRALLRILNADGSTDLFHRRTQKRGAGAASGNSVRLRAQPTSHRARCAQGKMVRRRSGHRRLGDFRASGQGGAKICACPILPIAKACRFRRSGRHAQGHIRDGAALTRFLCWFAREAPKGKLDEIGASEKLEEFASDGGAFGPFLRFHFGGVGARGDTALPRDALRQSADPARPHLSDRFRRHIPEAPPM